MESSFFALLSHAKLVAGFLIGFGLIVLIGSCTSKDNEPTFSEETESAAIYSVIINSEFEDSLRENVWISNRSISSRSGRYLAVFGSDYLERTSFDQRVQFLHKEMYPSVEIDTLNSFQRKFEEPYTFNTELNVTLSRIRIQRLDELDRPNDSEPSDDVVRFARVGFNSSKTQAFVEISYQCNMLCGFGNHILLEKESGEWKIKTTFDGWRT